jgi:hypothetical protein
MARDAAVFGRHLPTQVTSTCRTKSEAVYRNDDTQNRRSAVATVAHGGVAALSASTVPDHGRRVFGHAGQAGLRSGPGGLGRKTTLTVAGLRDAR